MTSPSPSGAAPRPRPSTLGGAEVDVAAYLAFSRTWGTWWHDTGLEYQRVERRSERLVRQLCRWTEPAMVLEIGAHQAAFARWAAQELPDSSVVAFEANPHVHARFAERMADTRVDYRHSAVGPVSGDIELRIPTRVRGNPKRLSGRMASLEQHTEADDTETVTVPCTRLDDAVDLPVGGRVVAWVDVEGANGPVLESGPRVLDRVDVLHIEVESSTTWEGQWLDTDVAVHLRQHGLVPLARDIQQRRRQYNVVFVRGDLVHDTRVTARAAHMLRPADTR